MARAVGELGELHRDVATAEQPVAGAGTEIVGGVQRTRDRGHALDRSPFAQQQLVAAHFLRGPGVIGGFGAIDLDAVDLALAQVAALGHCVGKPSGVSSASVARKFWSRLSSGSGLSAI